MYTKITMSDNIKIDLNLLHKEQNISSWMA